MSNGVVMNEWPWLSLFTDSELSERADELKQELRSAEPGSAHERDLEGELHWAEWHLKTRNPDDGGITGVEALESALTGREG